MKMFFIIVAFMSMLNAETGMSLGSNSIISSSLYSKYTKKMEKYSLTADYDAADRESSKEDSDEEDLSFDPSEDALVFAATSEDDDAEEAEEFEETDGQEISAVSKKVLEMGNIVSSLRKEVLEKRELLSDYIAAQVIVDQEDALIRKEMSYYNEKGEIK